MNMMFGVFDKKGYIKKKNKNQIKIVTERG